MENPKVAVITAMYNSEKFIERAAQSVANQTYNNLIWIIYDDASTDNSVNVLEDLIESDGTIGGIPVKLLKNTINKKQGFGRNQCIMVAPSDVTLFKNLDADDYMLPTCIENHVKAWLRSPEEISCVYSDYFIQDDSTGLTTYEYKQSFSHEELHRHCIVSSGCMFPRWALDKVGLYYEDEVSTEDYGLALRLSNVGVMIHLSSAEWVYRVHSNNSTIKNLQQHQAAFPTMIKNYQDWRKSNNL